MRTKPRGSRFRKKRRRNSSTGHAGILNIFTFAHEQFPNEPVDAIIGGLHLFPATDDQLNWTADKLKDLKVTHLIGGHCTGIEAVSVRPFCPASLDFRDLLQAIAVIAEREADVAYLILRAPGLCIITAAPVWCGHEGKRYGLG